MAQQLETPSIEESEPALTGEQTTVPASPASLWASESTVHYSITHTAEGADTRALIDCDCVIHSD